jgi:hypothetical protein
MRIAFARSIVSASLVFLLGASGSAQVQVVTLSALADATLYDAPQLANGAGEHLFAGVTNHAEVRRALVTFDVAGAIPPGALVVGVELQLTIDRTFHFAPLPVALHRVLASWTEGSANPAGNEGGGAAAAVGDTTWHHRSAPGSFWGAAGSDHEAVASASCTTPDQWVPVLWTTTPRLVADVRGWLATPATNHGWLLRTAEVQGGAIRRFASRTNPVVAARPVLRVQFVARGTWAPLGDGCGAVAPTIAMAGSLQPGTSVLIQLQGTAGNTFGALFGALAVAVPGAALLPGCSLMLDPGQAVALALGPLDASGQLAGAVAIPGSPLLSGQALAAQALLDVPTPAGVGLQLSAAAVAVLP